MRPSSQSQSTLTNWRSQPGESALHPHFSLPPSAQPFTSGDFRPLNFVAFCDRSLEDPDALTVLKKLAANPDVKGIRQVGTLHSNPTSGGGGSKGEGLSSLTR